MPPINLLHDPFRPAHCVGNGADRSRNSCSTVVWGELASRKNRRHDCDYAFPALVHVGSLAFSLYVRHHAGRVRMRCSQNTVASGVSRGNQMPVPVGHKGRKQGLGQLPPIRTMSKNEILPNRFQSGCATSPSRCEDCREDACAGCGRGYNDTMFDYG